MIPVETLDRLEDSPAGLGAIETAPPAAYRLAALWALYVLTVRQHLHGKRWMAMAALFLLPAGLVVLIRSLSPHAPPSMALEFSFAFMFIPQALLPLVALIYGSGIIQDEQEEQTLTYLLIRPISKWALYGVKLLATLTTTVALTAMFTALTYAAIYVKAENVASDVPMRCIKAMSLHSLAVVAYCCLFGLMSLLTKRTLIVGIIYSAIFEGLLANLPLSIRLVTVIYYTRVIAYRTMSFVEQTRHGNFDLAEPKWQMGIKEDPDLLQHPQVLTCVMVLLVSSVVCAVLAAFLCARREFHVKTPEKN
jgi:ABC-2 type transport system permease protein